MEYLEATINVDAKRYTILYIMKIMILNFSPERSRKRVSSNCVVSGLVINEIMASNFLKLQIRVVNMMIG